MTQLKMPADFADVIYIGSGEASIEAAFRPDLLGRLPWPVYCVDTPSGPRCWRLVRISDEAWPRVLEVTDHVRRALALALEVTRGRVALAQHVKDQILNQEDRGAAPLIRRDRTEVALEPTVELDERGRVIGRKYVDRTQTALRRYLRHKEITQRQFDAGLRLQNDWEASQLEPRTTIDPTAVSLGGGNPAETIMKIRTVASAARREFQGALESLGSRLRPVVLIVVCADRPASEWAQAIKWPPGHGLPVLKVGLDTLGDHYRLAG